MNNQRYFREKLKRYLSTVKGTSASDRYVIAREIDEVGGDMISQIVKIGPWEELATEFRTNFDALKGDGKSLFMQSVEEFSASVKKPN